MKSQVLVLVFLASFLFLLHTSEAQSFPSASSRPGSRSPEMGSTGENQPVAFSGVVQVEGGADVMKDTAVILDCGFGERARTNLDPRGHFTLIVDDKPSVENSNGVPARVGAPMAGCRLRAEAPGYRSSTLDLTGQQTGLVEVGTITISPVATQPGSEDPTVSAASLAAPDNAKKNFEKGQGHAKKGKWEAAVDEFRKAVRAYPKYAIAWLELGRAQLHENNPLGAEQSFQEATTHDAKLLPAYVELANLQASQQQWKALAMTTSNIVGLAPESSASFWFLDSAANYNLQNLQRAQSSAERGLRLDAGHHVPQLEYLYALILGSKQNYASAVEHIKSYLRLAPQAKNLHEAQNRLAQFERLASAQTAQGSQ